MFEVERAVEPLANFNFMFHPKYPEGPSLLTSQHTSPPPCERTLPKASLGGGA